MKNLMAWKERGYDNAPSVRDFMSQTPYPELEQKAIIDYLDNFGITTSASTGVGTDILTGEMISVSYESKNDGEYSWMNTLSYYIKRYNIQLPKEFVKKTVEATKNKYV